MNLAGMATWCMVCREPIPEERVRRRSNCCSREHAQMLRRFYRSLADLKRCRSCAKPSSPEERARFRAWRQAERAASGVAGPRRGWPKGKKRGEDGRLAGEAGAE